MITRQGVFKYFRVPDRHDMQPRGQGDHRNGILELRMTLATIITKWKLHFAMIFLGEE